MVLSRVRLIRVKLVLVNLNPINDTYSRNHTRLKDPRSIYVRVDEPGFEVCGDVPAITW